MAKEPRMTRKIAALTFTEGMSTFAQAARYITTDREAAANGISTIDKMAKALRVLAAPDLDDAFVEAVSGPIYSCWQAIGSDCEQGCRDMKEKLTNKMAIEACLDADRLTMYPGGERGNAAEALLQRAYDGHGYDVVFTLLCKRIPLA